ncbi:short-chain dehydrogenase [Arachidicoccus ginsenosidimutans]|uniref:SDR family oxidoreductase n=1 Tax=Arachidicoccus sp. BS20 TaxID=1850526 RepID=UPI0007F0E921|nr:SDR family oxidoreductase [Arachidicoccus sp. BS20]ANI89874.1 short-chain dehydrogenase [Arachidicoccus sp. BS20]
MNIVITGATKGIGRAVVFAFANDVQSHNFFVCARNENDLQHLKTELVHQFPRHAISVFACDMSDKLQVLSFAKSISGTVDILINNAGIYFPGGTYNEEDGVLEKMLSVNLLSAYHLTRALLPKMMEKKRGHIFNMCSIASLKAYENGGSYSISKFALAGFTKNLREELKPHGIKVSGVYPGATMSDSWKGSGVDEKRIMEANDIAKMIHAAAYLSPQAVMEDIVLRPQLGDL